MPYMLVVPLAGTWIETYGWNTVRTSDSVVPLAGTWIETSEHMCCHRYHAVVPLAGTWIETGERQCTHCGTGSRSPCGNVD